MVYYKRVPSIVIPLLLARIPTCLRNYKRDHSIDSIVIFVGGCIHVEVMIFPWSLKMGCIQDNNYMSLLFSISHFVFNLVLSHLRHLNLSLSYLNHVPLSVFQNVNLYFEIDFLKYNKKNIGFNSENARNKCPRLKC